LAVLALTATVYLVEWLEKGMPGALALAALAAGAMAWTKQEGLVLLSALCLAAAVVLRERPGGIPARRRWLGVATLLIAGAALASPWLLIVGRGREDLALAAHLGRAPTIARMMVVDLLSPDASFVWPLTLLFALRRSRAAGTGPRASADLLPVTATLYLALMSTAYLFSTYVPYQQHVANSFHRLAMHVVTLLVLWVACHGKDRL